jgi:hypothetical protein
MKIEEVTVKATQEEIIARIKKVRGADILWEIVPPLLEYLDFERAEPFIKRHMVEEARTNWKRKGDEDLQAEIMHHMDLWGQAVRDGKTIQIWSGCTHMANRLFLAGIELWKEIEWKEIREEEIGPYISEGIDKGFKGLSHEEAYNKVADLFGLPHVFDPRC